MPTLSLSVPLRLTALAWPLNTRNVPPEIQG